MKNNEIAYVNNIHTGEKKKPQNVTEMEKGEKSMK